MKQAKLENPTRYWLNKKFSEEHIKNNAQARKGKNTGEDHILWKGDNATYSTKHNWMIRHFGQPQFCEGCGIEEAKRFEWANLSGQYKRERSDWMRLCKVCHNNYDDVTNKGWLTRRAVLGL